MVNMGSGCGLLPETTKPLQVWFKADFLFRCLGIHLVAISLEMHKISVFENKNCSKMLGLRDTSMATDALAPCLARPTAAVILLLKCCCSSALSQWFLHYRDMCKPINVLTGLDYWLDNLMCNVPELAMCYHLNGIVQVGCRTHWDIVLLQSNL